MILKARHILGRLNVIADKLSTLGQTIQTEWSLLLEVIQTICSRWHRPQIDLFATRFNSKFPLFVSPVPDPWSLQWMHSVCHGRIWMHMSPTSSHIGQSGGEIAGLPLQKNNSDSTGVAKHALVLGPSYHVQSIPIKPAQSAQPVNTALQSDPSQKSDNLNLHASLLEPQQSRSRASVKQWQKELRLLKEDQPDQSTRHSGPFLQSFY